MKISTVCFTLSLTQVLIYICQFYLLQFDPWSTSSCATRMTYSSLGHSPLVISHNVRGLTISEQCSIMLQELKKGRPNFVFLQETHFKMHHLSKLVNHYFTKAFHVTNNNSRSKGVSILVSNELLEQMADPGGRFIFLKGTYGDMPVTCQWRMCTSPTERM